MKVYYLVFKCDAWDGTNKRAVKVTRSPGAAERARAKANRAIETIAYIETWLQPSLFEELNSGHQKV